MNIYRILTEWLTKFIPQTMATYVVLPGAIALVVVVVATFVQVVPPSTFIVAFGIIWVGVITFVVGRALMGVEGSIVLRLLAVCGAVLMVLSVCAAWVAWSISSREFVATNVAHHACQGIVEPTKGTRLIRVWFKSLSGSSLNVWSYGAPRSDRYQGTANPHESMTIGGDAGIEEGATLRVRKGGQNGECIEDLVIDGAWWHFW
jgi:hypothetical protein